VASRYLVATGNYNTTAVWSATSGGASGASVPTSADDVFLDAASGTTTLTINVASACRSFDCAGFTGTVVHAAGITFSIGNGVAGIFRLVSGMSYTLGNAATSALSFVSTTTGNTITTASKTIGNVTFNGAGGGWTLQDSITTGTAATVTLTAGSLVTNGMSLSIGAFASSNSNVRALTLGASTITLNSSTTTSVWDITTPTNMTLSAGTSSISFTSTFSLGAIFITGGLTYNTVICTHSGAAIMQGGGVFNNFTKTVATAFGNSVTFDISTTISGTLTLTGSAARRLLCKANSNTGGAIVLTVGAVSLTNVDFQDITAAGTAAPFSGTLLGDCYGNTNITFPASTTRYWVGGSGSWSQTAHWSATSGGAGGASVPLPQDDARFTVDSFSAAGATVTLDMIRIGRLVDFTGITNTPTITASLASELTFYGTLILVSGITFTVSANGVKFSGRSVHAITMAGKSFGGSSGVGIDAPGGSYTLLASFVTSGTFSVQSGAFDASSFTLTCASFIASGSLTRSVTFGPTVVITGTSGTVISLSGTGLTFNASSTSLIINTTSSGSRTIDLSGKTVGLIEYTIAASTGTLSFSTSGTIGTLNVCGGTRTVQLISGTTLTFTQAVNIAGSPGNLITIARSSGTTTFSKSSGTMSVTYASISGIIASGGAAWYAYDSTNGGNNSGWIFTPSFFGWGISIN